MTVDSTIGIVRILRSDGQTAGTGFVLTDDGLIVTCAHVIGSAEAGTLVRLVFHHTGTEATATLELDGWRSPQAEDVAFLRLDGLLPTGVRPLPLGFSAGVASHPFETFGFPEANHNDGLWGTGVILGELMLGGVRALQLRSQEVTPGFSGAPLWNQVTEQVVGMVTAITRPDNYGRLVETAFATPTETLQAIRPDITLKPPPPSPDGVTFEQTLRQAVADYQSRLYQTLALATVPPTALPAASSSPYKFLYAYELEDGPFFFGRDAAIATLHQKVRQDRLTILYARSGAGKTSLLNAGLAPHLIREGCLPVFARSYNDPIQAIKQAIVPPARYVWPARLTDMALPEFLEQVGRALTDPARELAIILDQFEEFFLFHPQPEPQQGLAQALGDCYDAKSLPARFIITIREEYFVRLGNFSGRLPSIFNNNWQLSPMSLEEAQRAIVEPLARFDPQRTYEPALLDRILADLAGGGMELPHLQIICDRLYQALPSGQNRLTLDLYQTRGEAKGILGGYLTTTLEQHFAGQSALLARQALKTLVSSIATRRILSLTQLEQAVQPEPATPSAPIERGELETVLDRLVNARLLRRLEQADQTLYEMAHDYLAAEIQSWLNQEEVIVKQAEELLERERANWRASKTLMSGDHLVIITAQANALKLDAEAQEFLLRSALTTGQSIDYWYNRYSDRNQAATIVVAFLLGDNRSQALNLANTLWPAHQSRTTTWRPVVEQLQQELQAEEVWRRQRAREIQVFVGPMTGQTLWQKIENLPTAFRLLVPANWSAILLMTLGGGLGGLLGGMLQVFIGVGFEGTGNLRRTATYGLAMAIIAALIGTGWQLGAVVGRGRSPLTEIGWAVVGGIIGGFLFIFYFVLLDLIIWPTDWVLLFLVRPAMVAVLAAAVVVGIQQAKQWIRPTWRRDIALLVKVIGATLVAAVTGALYDLGVYGYPAVTTIVTICLAIGIAIGLSLPELIKRDT